MNFDSAKGVLVSAAIAAAAVFASACVSGFAWLAVRRYQQREYEAELAEMARLEREGVATEHEWKTAAKARELAAIVRRAADDEAPLEPDLDGPIVDDPLATPRPKLVAQPRNL